MSQPVRGCNYDDEFLKSLNFSELDKLRVVEFLDRWRCCKHRIDEQVRWEIIGDDGATYEHKADRQGHKTKNLVIEIRNRRTGKRQWLYYCEADYLIVTERGHIRIYEWKPLQYHLIRFGFEMYRVVRMGDRWEMDGFLLSPDNQRNIAGFLVYDGPWRQPDLDEILAHRKETKEDGNRNPKLLIRPA